MLVTKIDAARRQLVTAIHAEQDPNPDSSVELREANVAAILFLAVEGYIRFRQGGPVEAQVFQLWFTPSSRRRSPKMILWRNQDSKAPDSSFAASPHLLRPTRSRWGGRHWRPRAKMPDSRLTRKPSQASDSPLTSVHSGCFMPFA